jgi:hypothetical protein
MINWIKRKMALLAFALSKAEISTLHQKEDALDSPEGMSQTMNQGSILDALKKGEMTLPVKELRWRLYKVLNESKGKTATITGYDEDGLPIVKTYTVDKYKLDKVIRDDSDDYPVEMVVKNEALTQSTFEAFDKFDTNYVSGDTRPAPKQEMFELVGQEMSGTSFTHVEMSFDDMMSTFKDKKTLFFQRELRPKFELESYVQKMLVRNISNDEKLLELYVSAYTDEYNRKSRLFINEIKRAIKNPRFTDMLDITKVNFITDKAIGSADGLEYEYEIKKFDKIIEFNGSYVIKFIAKPIVNGDNIFEKYKLAELEERYRLKKAK